jgi:phage terminase small subunit
LDPNGITLKMRRFAEEYLACWNGSEAARRAGYANETSCAHRLLHNPKVKKYIDARMCEMTMAADEVLARITEQARQNPSDFFLFEWQPKRNDDGKVIFDVNGNPIMEYVMTGINWDMVEHHGYLIKKISYDRFGRPMLEFHDAQNALIQIGRAHKLFVDRNELSGSDGAPLTIRVQIEKDDDAAS